MEELLHYCWQHKLLPLSQLTTTDGRSVEVIDPGLHNQHAGPDFFNAKVKIDGMLWVGNVEIHDKASDWYRHGHDKDANYDSVILHVVGEVDAEARTMNGTILPQMKLEVPQSVTDNYEALLRTETYPPCYKIIPTLSKLMIHSWLSAMETERLERKTDDIVRRVGQCGGSWENAYFVTLARNFGFSTNSDAFEQWALNVPLDKVGHHRDDIFQIEAIFMGQAGLLEEDCLPERYRASAHKEGYFDRLRDEYRYMAHKFQLHPMDNKLWRFLRLRPQNFPHIRISQLATLYYRRQTGLSELIEQESLKDVTNLLQTEVTDYWRTHYTFGAPGPKSTKKLSAASANLIIINTAIPMLFAYGRHKDDDRLCNRAFDFLDALKAENNNIVRMWQECGLSVESAGDSQALIQLKKEYCDKKECIRCRIGYEYLKGKSFKI